MRTLFAALVLLLAAAPSARAAEPAWRSLGEAATPLRTDGERYAVWMLRDGRVAVRDDAIPERSKVLEIGANCELGGVGAGNVAVQCRQGPTAPVSQWALLDLRSGRLRALPDLTRLLASSEAPRITAVGRRWIEAVAFRTDAAKRLYVRIRDAAVRTVDGPRSIPDLDARRVRSRLCRPVRRPRATDPRGPLLEPATRDGRWVVFGRDAAITAWRCGRRRAARLAPPGSSGLQAGGGLVTWQRGAEVGVHRLRGRRTAFLTTGTIAPPGPVLSPAHTRGIVYVSLPRESPPEPDQGIADPGVFYETFATPAP